ncbi:MAG: hypothetical protein WBZ20_15440, partial [Nitrososphaeraceae archaeon]
ESSVQIATDNQISQPQSLLHFNINYGMRDLYHRKERLMVAYWINRTNADLQEPNKTDVGNSEGI